MSDPHTCSFCGDQPMPGVRWPVGLDRGATFLHGWVERCDECELYPNDNAALSALASRLIALEHSFVFGLATPENSEFAQVFIDVADYNRADHCLNAARIFFR